MVKENPLYEDSQLKITLLIDSDESLWGGDKYELWLSKTGNQYVFQRGILKQLARTSRNDIGTFLERLHPGIGISLRDCGLTYDSVGMAISRAYLEKGERHVAWLRRNGMTP